MSRPLVADIYIAWGITKSYSFMYKKVPVADIVYWRGDQKWSEVANFVLEAKQDQSDSGYWKRRAHLVVMNGKKKNEGR